MMHKILSYLIREDYLTQVRTTKKITDRLFFIWRLRRLMDQTTGVNSFSSISLKDVKAVDSKFEMFCIAECPDLKSSIIMLDEGGYHIAGYYWAGLLRFYPQIKQFVLKVKTIDGTELKKIYTFNSDSTVAYFSTIKNKWEKQKMEPKNLPA